MLTISLCYFSYSLINLSTNYLSSVFIRVIDSIPFRPNDWNISYQYANWYKKHIYSTLGQIPCHFRSFQAFRAISGHSSRIHNFGRYPIKGCSLSFFSLAHCLCASISHSQSSQLLSFKISSPWGLRKRSHLWERCCSVAIAAEREIEIAKGET